MPCCENPPTPPAPAARGTSVGSGHRHRLRNFASTLLVLGVTLGLLSAAAHATQIGFAMTDLADSPGGGDLWEARYQLAAFDGDAGSLLSIRFDAEDTHALETAALADLGPQWTVLTPIQPEPLLGSDGRFELLLAVPVPALPIEWVVRFQWQGASPPAAQAFEVFDAQFAITEIGTTLAVPEGGTGLLVLAGILLLLCRRVLPQAGSHSQKDPAPAPNPFRDAGATLPRRS